MTSEDSADSVDSTDSTDDSIDLHGVTGDPTLIDTVCTRLSLSGMRPIIMGGMILNHLAQHFSRLTSIQDEYLRKERFLWKGTDDETGIQIDAVWDWTPAITNKRPAILLSYGGQKSPIIGVGDKEMGVDPVGNEVTAKLWVGSHTLFPVTEIGSEALLLATEVQRELDGFAPVLRTSLNLFRLRVGELGNVAQVRDDGARDRWTVPINVSWAYWESQRVILQARPLRKVSLTLLEDFL